MGFGFSSEYSHEAIMTFNDERAGTLFSDDQCIAHLYLERK
jgi:hypothetical protein